jgi:hypothetical protein
MFDIMKYAEKNHVEIDVRPGVKPVVWEFFIRDRKLDLVQFTQIQERELARQHNVDEYIEKRCDELMQSILESRKLQKLAETEEE